MKNLEQAFASFPVLNINNDFVLRQFKKSDAKNYFNFYQIPEINMFVPDIMIPRNVEEAEFEIAGINQSFSSKQTIYWAIAEKKTDRLIGGCGFHDFVPFNKRIEIAYDLHPEFWRRGIMLQAIKEIVKFGFLQMGLERIQATAVEENIASINLLLKFGFQKEGLLRKYKFFKNKMTDILIFGYTKDDFKRDIMIGKL